VVKKQAKSKAKQPRVPLSITVETFNDPAYEMQRMNSHVWNAPYCINGTVSLRRYRITAVEIDEPIEVLRDRLAKLWRESDNYHHRQPLRAVAAELGMELDPLHFGMDRRDRK
jgi:hypothetical protein